MPPPSISAYSRIAQWPESVTPGAGSRNTKWDCSSRLRSRAAPPTNVAGSGSGAGAPAATPPNSRSARRRRSFSSTAPEALTTSRSGAYSAARQASSDVGSAGSRLSAEPRIGRPRDWPVNAASWASSKT